MKVGFQSKNPTTDFRGTGKLGLIHLWEFSLTNKKSQEIFSFATNEKTWYFYAATSINITGIALKTMEKEYVKQYYFNCKNKSVNFDIICRQLYIKLFLLFNEIWEIEGHCDFMKVNEVLMKDIQGKTNELLLEVLNEIK